MIWSKADGEDANHPKGQHADLPFSLGAQAGTLSHGGQHPPVAHGQHQQGQQEADAYSEQVEQGNRGGNGVRFIATVIVVDLIVGVSEIVIDQYHDVQSYHHSVHSCTLCPGVAGRTLGLGAEWEGDHQAAVYGDAAEQVEADVHVGVVDEASYTAGSSTELPAVVLSVIVDPKGHSKDEENVRERQVEQEDAQNVLPPHLLANGAQGQHMEDQTKYKSNNVNGHQKVTDGAVANVNTQGSVCGVRGVHCVFCFLSL